MAPPNTGKVRKRPARSRLALLTILCSPLLSLPLEGAEAIAHVRKAKVNTRTHAVRGTVTLQQGALPSDATVFYIQDDSGGIAVRAAEMMNLTLTDVVEAQGPLEIVGGEEPQIAAMRVKVVGRAPPVKPRPVSVDDAFGGQHAGTLAKVRAIVEKLTLGETRDAIHFKRDGEGLRAYLRRPADRPSVFPTLAPVQAEVEATGILVPMSGGVCQLRLRTVGDLAQLRGPRFVDPVQIAIWLGICGLVLGAFALWNYVLRRSIRHQTAEIRTLLERATESSRLKSEFLANLSHEIRTPIHGILGMQALLLESPLTAPQRDELRSAQDCTEHLLKLLDEVLDFSRMEADQVVLEAADFSTARVLLGVSRGFEAQGRLKGIQIRCQVRDVPEFVVGDAMRLRQILLNLTANAVKFTEHGHVEMSVVSTAAPAGRVRLTFSVADTGIGIPLDKQALIFESFRQVDGSISRRYGGSGLGLAIASGLVELMGGRLEVDSDEGQGSRFYFTAEFGESTAPHLPVPLGAVIVAASGCPELRVLVAEDNTVNQRLVKRMLEKDGHAVSLVATGNGAVAAAHRDEFDVILMDVQMPEMDGLEATRAIREAERLEQRARLPIYALTAHSMPGDKERCLAAGMDGCLTKPFLPQDLRNLLASVNAAGEDQFPMRHLRQSAQEG